MKEHFYEIWSRHDIVKRVLDLRRSGDTDYRCLFIANG